MNKYSRKHEILRFDKVSASFHSIQVLNAVSFSLMKSEILGIVGSLNSGKTTIFHLLLNERTADSGTIFINNQILSQTKSDIIIIKQSSSLIPQMTIAENLFITIPRIHRGFFLNSSYINKKTNAIFDELQIPLIQTMKVCQLSSSQKHLIELIRAYILGKKIVLIDEILGNYSWQEKQDFYNLVKKLQKRGMSFIITANSSELLSPICDRILYLYDGILIKQLTQEDFGSYTDAELFHINIPQHKYIPPATASSSIPIFEIRNLTGKNVSSLNVCSYNGQITEVFNLSTAEIENIMGILSGKTPSTGGEISFHGVPIKKPNYTSCAKLGIYFLYMDAITSYLFHNLSLLDNIYLFQYKRLGLIPHNVIKYLTNQAKNLLGITDTELLLAPEKRIDIRLLYRAFLNRLASQNPKVLICSNSYIRNDPLLHIEFDNFFNEILSNGTSVLIFSSDDK